MKKLLLILLCLPIIGFGQQTYVPDDTFEQRLINLGYDSVLDDYITTSSIDTVTRLFIDWSNACGIPPISDLTGIEDFVALELFECPYNQIANLDLSNNTSLKYLECHDNLITNLNLSNCTSLIAVDCSDNLISSLNTSNLNALKGLDLTNNQLSSLDVSNILSLETLTCGNNQLTSLDVSNNLNLFRLSCFNNQLTNIDVSNNLSLEELYCSQNLLTCLDISNNILLTEFYSYNNLLEQLNTKNGNWQNMYVEASSNNLTCVEVDNIGYASSNWFFDSFATLSTNCNYTSSCNTTSSIEEQITNKNLLKTINILGVETKGSKNQPLLYIYDDGTVEKRITIN